MRLRWRSIATHAALLLATCVAVVPLAWLLRTALGTRLIATSNPPIIFFTPTLDSFIAVLTGPFTKYLFNSAVIVTSSVAIVMVLGSLAGYSLARFNIKGKESMFFYVITDRIRLGTWVTNPVSRHPLITASAVATLADIAPGRTYLGIGAGGTGCGTSVRGRRRLISCAPTSWRSAPSWR